MNQEMIEKIEELVTSGKITDEQKEVLLQALVEINQNSQTSLVEATYPDREKQELIVQLVYEDVVVMGKNEATEVEIVKGADLVELIKSGDTIQIQSKKENGGFVGQLIKRRSFIKQKNGFVIQDKRSAAEVIISVPSSINMRLKTVSGDIQIQNLESDIQAKSVSGDITLKSHHNKASLHSISGDIHINKMCGTLESTSKSGDISINLADIQGEVKTYSGDIQINCSTLVNMEISVFSGDIEIEQTTCNQLIQCKTFSGDLHMELTNPTGYVKGVTASGEMKVITAERTKVDLTNQEYGNPGNSLQIQLKTLSGDAKISFTKE